MSAWSWIDIDLVIAVHDQQIAEHGGASGVPNKGSVEAALTRPKHLTADQDPDVASLAAAYAWGIAANHGFADGNRRTAWVVARLFIADNGYTLRFDPFDAIRIMQGIAGKSMSEEDLAQWFRERISERI